MLKYMSAVVPKILKQFDISSVSVCVCVFRLLQEQMEQSLSDVQHRLSVKTNELQAAHKQIDRLEDRIGVCQNSVLYGTLLIFSSAYLYLIISCSVFSFQGMQDIPCLGTLPTHLIHCS